MCGLLLSPVWVGGPASPAWVGGGESGFLGGAAGGSTLSVMGVSSRTLVGRGSSAANAVAGITPGWRGATLGTGTPWAHCIPGAGGFPDPDPGLGEAGRAPVAGRDGA
jgi:hypothetical protein